MINMKQLLTEEVAPKQRLTETDHVRSGLEKVFGAGDAEVSYNRCENVGLGYIKNISEAFKCAMLESKKVAKTYGYTDVPSQEKYVKENDYSKLSAEKPEDAMAKVASNEQPQDDEKDMSDPTESREVQIGKEILNLTKKLVNHVPQEQWATLVTPIQKLANELISMHGQTP